jgi:2',3'-cyclic-nucleotide 2'-phosphodiesterase (5'-nucleotidase family)
MRCTVLRVTLGIIAWALGAVIMVQSVRADERTVEVTLLFVCDIYDMAPNAHGRGGLAKVAAVFNAERAARKNVVTVHAGDAISPSLMSGLDKGAHMIDLLNGLQLDFFVPGNHEYDFGPEIFMKRMAEAKFPVFAANLAGPDGKPIPGISNERIFEFDGLKLGFIGLTAEDSITRSSPGNLKFSPSPDKAIELAAKLRKEGADLVVVVAHARRDLDEVLKREAGADVILSGDDHDLLLGYDGKVAFLEAMQDGYYVGAIDLLVSVEEKDGARRMRWWPNFRLIDTATISPDADMAARVASYEQQLSKELDQPLATLKGEMDSHNATVRGGEAPIGNLFADAVREELGADAALLNGGGIRGKKLYEAGAAISRRDVLTELPFGNKAYLLEITGKDLKSAVEQGLARAETLTGAFPQVSGIIIRADLSRPAGGRLVRLEVAGAPVDEAKAYRLATVDFLARGGDGYEALKRANILIGPNDGKLLASHVMEWLKAKGSVSPALEGRIIVARSAPPK